MHLALSAADAALKYKRSKILVFNATIMMLFNDALRKLGLKNFQSHVMSVTTKIIIIMVTGNPRLKVKKTVPRNHFLSGELKVL